MSTTTVQRQTLTVEEAAKMLGISRWLGYEQARNGHIGPVPVYRVGRKLIVPRAAVERFLGGELEQDAVIDGR